MEFTKENLAAKNAHKEFYCSDDAARTYPFELFCEKNGTAKQYVRKWMPVAAVPQSVIGRPGEKEFLKKCVKVAEYE